MLGSGPGADRDGDGRARGLILVPALSTRWDWYLTRDPAGKVVWCEIEALTPAALSEGDRLLPGHGVGGMNVSLAGGALTET